MNDDQLRAELERRSQAGSSDPELLSSVFASPGATRSTPSQLGRFVPAAGLLAVAAVVVLIAVTLPSRTPSASATLASGGSGLSNPATIEGPTATQSDYEAVDCTLASSGRGSPVRVEDHSGLVNGCQVHGHEYLEDATVTASDGGRTLDITWPVSCAADSWNTDLQLWRTEDIGSARPGLRHSGVYLVVNRIRSESDSGCRTAVSGRRASLELSDPVAVEDVHLLLVQDGRNADNRSTAGSDFELELVADGYEYTPEDPIQIEARLTYSGSEESVQLSGVTSLVNGFGAVQLIGPLSMGAGWDLPCVPHSLGNGDPLVVPFQKSVGYSEDDPNAAFYRAWTQEPELRLPAGTWLITAHSQFFVGSNCAGPEVVLEASVVIRVVEQRPSAPPTIAPTPSPPVSSPNVSLAPRTIECAEPIDRIGAVIIDPQGVVESCLTVEPVEGLQPTNPDGDRNQLQIEWDGSPCDAAVSWTLADAYPLQDWAAPVWSLTRGARPDGQHLGVESSDGRFACAALGVRHAVRLSLNREIDAATVVPDQPQLNPSPDPQGAARTWICASETDATFEVADFSGEVVGCEASEIPGAPSEFVTADNPDGDQNALRISWEAVANCPSDKALLRFWNTGPHADPRLDEWRPNYVLEVGRRSDGPQILPGCLGDPVTRTVIVRLETAVFADDVAAFVGFGPGRLGMDRTTAVGNEFSLALMSSAPAYGAYEPIDVSAALSYDGAPSTLAISGLSASIGLEQLDGDLEVHPPGTTLMCTDSHLSEGAPFEFNAAPSSFEQYSRDGLLTLPRGIYRFYARADFMVGPGCPGLDSQVDLATSVIVEVR